MLCVFTQKGPIVEPETSIYDISSSMYEYSVGTVTTQDQRVKSYRRDATAAEKSTVLLRWFCRRLNISEAHFAFCRPLLVESIMHRRQELRQREENDDPDAPAFALDRVFPPLPMRLFPFRREQYLSEAVTLTEKASYQEWYTLCTQLMRIHAIDHWDALVPILENLSMHEFHAHYEPLKSYTQTYIVPFLPYLQNSAMRVLDLSDSKVFNNDLKPLKGMPFLEHLSLQNCLHLTTNGLKHVSDMPRLQFLCINRLFTQTSRITRAFRRRGGRLLSSDTRGQRLRTNRLLGDMTLEELDDLDPESFVDRNAGFVTCSLRNAPAELPLHGLPALKRVVMQQVFVCFC